MTQIKSQTKGIIVGCDSAMEYLLPYFYLNFRLNSDLPIAFFDFGMSQYGRLFCEKRGQVLEIDESLINPSDPSPLLQSKRMWFKKPLACKLSPFDKTLWLDLDCKLLQPIDELFDQLSTSIDIAIVQEKKEEDKPITYNSGVMVFHKASQFLTLWPAYCQAEGMKFRGDQDVLSHILQKYKLPVLHLDPSFNFLYYKEGLNVPKQTKIVHYIGPFKVLLFQEASIIERTQPYTPEHNLWIMS